LRGDDAESGPANAFPDTDRPHGAVIFEKENSSYVTNDGDHPGMDRGTGNGVEKVEDVLRAAELNNQGEALHAVVARPRRPLGREVRKDPHGYCVIELVAINNGLLSSDRIFHKSRLLAEFWSPDDRSHVYR
jgi:hypothetical protein